MRKAASMIELVIAIVVMGIAMMTLPLMLTTTQSNNAFAMQQEGILAARTKLGDILTYRWDKNSEQNGSIKVLDTNSSYFRRKDTNSIRRIGHAKGNLRRKFFNINNANRYASPIPNNPNDMNFSAIEDFNNHDFNITSFTINGKDANKSQDYRFIDTHLHINVKYINDNNNTPFDFNTTGLNHTTNIKMIEVNTTTTDATSPDKNISFTLRAFSCNIGANELLRRPY